MLPYDVQNEQTERYRPDQAPLGPEGNAARPSEFSMRDVFYTLFRHKWKIVLLFLMTTAAAVFYVTHAADYYESEARVRISSLRKDLTINPNAGSGSLLSDTGGQDNLRGEIGIIRSASLANEVVQRVGVDKVLWSPPAVGPREPHAAGKPADSSPIATPGISEGVLNVARRIQSDLNLRNPKSSSHDLAVAVLQKSMDVGPDMDGSNILRLTYRAGNPQVAQQILQTILTVYEQYHIEAHQSDITPEFSDERAKEFRQQLEGKEKELAALKKRLDITSLQGQKDLYQQQLSALDQNDQQANVLISSLQARVRVYQELLTEAKKPHAGGDSTTNATASLAPNPLVELMRQKLMDLQLQESAMAQKYTDKNPQLAQLQSQVSDLKQRIVEQETGGPAAILAPAVTGGNPTLLYLNTLLQATKADLEGQIAGQQAVQHEITQTRANLNQLLSHESEVAGLERDVAALDQQYTQYKKTQQVAEFSQLLDQGGISNIKVIDQASYSPTSQKNIRKLLVLLVFGSLAGLGAGMALAFGLDFINPTLRRPEEVERYLGLPVMACIPHTRRHRVLIERHSA